MYSCSKSFRELKSAITNQMCFYLGGLGAKLSFFIEKNTWKNIGTTGEKYWVGLLFIHGWLGNNMVPVISNYNLKESSSGG